MCGVEEAVLRAVSVACCREAHAAAPRLSVGARASSARDVVAPRARLQCDRRERFAHLDHQVHSQRIALTSL